jgi:hypothetical protein
MEALHKLKRLPHLKLAGVLVGLNILDAILTQMAINNGMGETNLIMRYLLEQFGMGAWVIKITWAIGLVAIALWAGSNHPRALKIALIIFIVVFSVVCLRNGIGLIRVL